MLLLHKYHQNNRILPSLSSATRTLCHTHLRQSSPTLSLFVSTSREYSSTPSSNQREQQANKMTAGVDFYSLNAPLPGKDKVYDFDQLKGKVVLIVNVASKWFVLQLYTQLDGIFSHRFFSLHPIFALSTVASLPSTRDSKHCTRNSKTAASSSSDSLATRYVLFLLLSEAEYVN